MAGLLWLPSPTLGQGAAWQVEVGDIVYSVDISDDGAVQVVGSRNDSVQAFDATGNRRWQFEPGGTVWGVSTSADGALTAVASEDRHVYLLDDGRPAAVGLSRRRDIPRRCDHQRRCAGRSR